MQLAAGIETVGGEPSLPLRLTSAGEVDPLERHQPSSRLARVAQQSVWVALVFRHSGLDVSEPAKDFQDRQEGRGAHAEIGQRQVTLMRGLAMPLSLSVT